MRRALFHRVHDFPADGKNLFRLAVHRDRKSTRLNSSHGYISYAVFCLKKKNQTLYPRLSLPNPCIAWIISSLHTSPSFTHPIHALVCVQSRSSSSIVTLRCQRISHLITTTSLSTQVTA